MGLKQTTPPTTTVLATSDLRTQVSVDIPDHDNYLKGLAVAAERYVEEETGTQLMSATWTLTLDCFPAWELVLPRRPLHSVSSITYITAEDGSTATLSSTAYRVLTNNHKGRLEPAYNDVWPDTRDVGDAVTINFIAGSTSSTGVPPLAKHAIKMLVGHWFEHRESATADSVKSVPHGVDRIINLLDAGEYR